MRNIVLGDVFNGRCHVENDPGYPRYGALGVRVCAEWHQFTPFRDWAVNNGYQEDLSIDRIIPAGNYCPENCRWATMKEQMNNKRNTRYVTAYGETKPLSEWLEDERCELPKGTLDSRWSRGLRGEELLSPVYRSMTNRAK